MSTQMQQTITNFNNSIMQKDLVFQGILPQLQPNRNMRHVEKHHENRVWTEIYSGLMAGKLVADQPKETLNKRTIVEIYIEIG